jgi:hypothetical protein
MVKVAKKVSSAEWSRSALASLVPLSSHGDRRPYPPNTSGSRHVNFFLDIILLVINTKSPSHPKIRAAQHNIGYVFTHDIFVGYLLPRKPEYHICFFSQAPHDLEEEQ